MILLHLSSVKTVFARSLHFRVCSGNTRIVFAATLLFLLGLIIPVPPGSAQDDGTGMQLEIERPSVRGVIRYGRWAPLNVVIRQSGTADGFSGTLDVTGANGFSTKQDVRISAGLKRHQVTVPVFCNSQLPVFRVSLLDRSGREVGRGQQRYSSVLNPDDLVVGISRDVTNASINKFREELTKRSRKSVRVISAERRALTRIGRWPGLFDVVYLTEPAELAVPVRTDVSDVSSIPSDHHRIPDVRLVDQQAYDLFNPPHMSMQRRQWFGSTLTLLTAVLIIGVLFCFRDPSSPWNWLVLLALPVLVLVVLTARDPPSPPVIGQALTVRVSDSTQQRHVVDRRVSLFPQETDGKREEREQSNPDDGSSTTSATRSVRYPIRDLRRTIPLFHSSSAISTRFPRLDQTGNGKAFHWPDFPVGGYFVVQETQPVPYQDSALSVEQVNGDRQFIVKNQDRHPINTVWLHFDDSFYRIGKLAAEESRTIDLNKQERIDTRERFLGSAFSVDSRQQRMLSRWGKYVLQRYGRSQPYVMGVHSSHEFGVNARRTSYDIQMFPDLLMHRFGDVSHQ